jgi:hypothetical protein
MRTAISIPRLYADASGLKHGDITEKLKTTSVPQMHADQRGLKNNKNPQNPRESAEMKLGISR